MSEKLGPLAFGKREGEPFLGRDIGTRPDYSEQTAIEIDAEVRRIVMENYDRARQAITANLDKLKIIAEALLEFETIDTVDIDSLMGGGKIGRPPPLRPIGKGTEAKPDAGAAGKDKAKLPSFFPGPTKPEPA
jgi:cell division protease FtsH